MKYIAIIPARYASTRFPGKPLAMINGKAMIQRVYEQAKKALDRVVVATDDERIYDCVQGFGGEVVMTRSDHRCGTDRCLEAWHKVAMGAQETDGRQDIVRTDDRTLSARTTHDTIIINIQGDEPFIQPEQIRALCECFEGQEGASVDIATLVKPFKPTDGWEALSNPNSPKVVLNDRKQALLFSRSVIPYLRGVEKEEWLSRNTYYKHIGMYAYRAHVLEQITQLAPSPLEKAESLEQLRWLEAGYRIKVGITEIETIGIDTPEDLARAERALSY